MTPTSRSIKRRGFKLRKSRSRILTPSMCTPPFAQGPIRSVKRFGTWTPSSHSLQTPYHSDSEFSHQSARLSDGNRSSVIKLDSGPGSSEDDSAKQKMMESIASATDTFSVNSSDEQLYRSRSFHGNGTISPSVYSQDYSYWNPSNQHLEESAMSNQAFNQYMGNMLATSDMKQSHQGLGYTSNVNPNIWYKNSGSDFSPASPKGTIAAWQQMGYFRTALPRSSTFPRFQRVGPFPQKIQENCNSLPSTEFPVVHPPKRNPDRAPSQKMQKLKSRRKRKRVSRTQRRKPTKCLFLHLQGVINTEDVHLSYDCRDTSENMAKRIILLKHLVYLTGCKLVLTGNARWNAGFVKFVNDSLRIWGVEPISSATRALPLGDVSPEAQRASEVFHWLKTRNVKNWCIVDTMNLSVLGNMIDNRAILVDDRQGLTWENARAILQVLGVELDLYR